MAYEAKVAKAAVAAVRNAAERLGVDPLRLAEWLEGDDRLGNVLALWRRKDVLPVHRAEVERTLRDYLAFLEGELERRRTELGLGN
jgi:hypothetical protein